MPWKSAIYRYRTDTAWRADGEFGGEGDAGSYELHLATKAILGATGAGCALVLLFLFYVPPLPGEGRLYHVFVCRVAPKWPRMWAWQKVSSVLMDRLEPNGVALGIPQTGKPVLICAQHRLIGCCWSA